MVEATVKDKDDYQASGLMVVSLPRKGGWRRGQNVFGWLRAGAGWERC